MRPADGRPPLNLEIRIDRLTGSRLVDDYYASAPELARFFIGAPWDPGAYRRKLADVDARFDRAARERIVEALRPTSDAAAAKLREAADGDAVFVTTGQQAGLFTGPLYTVYKLLSAVQLARALEPVLERAVIPLFWVAADDHDWREIDHAELLDPANRLLRIALPHAEVERPIPAGARRVGDGIESALEELRTALPETEFTPPLLERVRAAYAPEQTMSGAFAELIASLFAEFDVVLVDPRHPTLKRAAAPLLARELAGAADHEARLAAQTERLTSAGYHAQVTVLPGEANVFYEGAAGRERLVRDGAAWSLKSSGERFDGAELERALAQHPERFSPNVFLRPVVESALLPTVSYVAGPAELSYFAQIGCLFRAHDVDMPVVFPRFGGTLVETKVAKVLQRHDLEPAAFARPVQEVAAEVVRDEVPPELAAAIAAARESTTGAWARIAELAQQIDPTLKGPVQSGRNTSLQQLSEAEKKIEQAVKRRSATVVEQVEKVAINLYPRGAPQERVLNVLQYLSRYGPELLPAIAAGMRVELEAAEPAWAGVECV